MPDFSPRAESKLNHPRTFMRRVLPGWLLPSLLIAMGLAVSAVPAAAQLPIAVEARADLLARAYNASGQRLFQELASAPGNVVLSPYSVGTAMAMALVGARGDTAVEMARVLMQRMAPEGIETANAEMLAILRSYDHSRDPPTCPPGMAPDAGRCQGPTGRNNQCLPGMQLAGNRCIGDGTPPPSARLLVANALMLLRHGDLIADDYITTLRTRFGAEAFRDARLDDINGWVSRATDGKIGKLVDRVDPNDVAVLLDAVYFKARWASPFDKALTKDESFSLTAAQTVDVPMMNKTGMFSLVSRGGYRAIRLPYDIPDIGMIVVLPDAVDGVGDVARRLGTNELGELLGSLRNGQSRRPLALALPRFKAEFGADLVAPFAAAGMHLAFDPRAADFSGMTGRPVPPGTLSIGAIAHRALIEIAEETTEAAAATGITIKPNAVAVPQIFEPFRVDHPFLFYLVEDRSGAILFEGRIADPR